MASAVERSPPSFTRSQSSPDLFSLSSFDTPADAASRRRDVLGWQSWTDLPAFEVPTFNSDFELDTSVFSHGRLAQLDAEPAPEPAPEPPARDSDDGTPARLSRKSSLARSRTVSLINRPRSWLSSSSGRPTKDAALDDADRSGPLSSAVDKGAAAAAAASAAASAPRAAAAPLQLSETRPPDRAASPASVTFANFARWSWTASSRSPSPKTVSEPAAAAKAAPSRRAKAAPPERLQLLTDADFNNNKADPCLAVEPPKPAAAAAAKAVVARSGSYFSKRKSKPPALVTDGLDSDNSCASSSASTGNRASNSGKMSASQSTCSDGNANTPITDESSTEATPTLRDPLSSSFKSLESDLKAFGLKQTAQRVGQLKNAVVPFLRASMDHKSVKSLSIEDVDRRATVLSRWWAAILDMLHDRAHHPVPGVDRPVLLEAATLLMMRPEWRQATTYFQPLADRLPSERVRARSWTNTSKSSDASHRSALLIESAEHNVRTMFVANLVRQMGYVVDKMSVRHAPLSLVNFSAKTCAYAFFFAPGVADILVRLWGLTPELIRRTADAFRLPRRDGGESDDIVALFPPKLGPFGWTSARAMWDMLKQIPKMSLLVARISWTGPWVSRWKGRDTDLFFIFCKYFHVLSDQFMPPGLPVTEKARSPAFVLVHAQLLSVLDTTIHRQMAIEHAYGPPLIDSVNGADATALALPLPPTNLMKGMAENGLVMLLRDFLSDDAPEMVHARHTFAESFACLMKGATCRTSQFNSAACFTLCDFLEEVMAIYHDFECRGGPSGYVDWDFWLDVCKRILGSLNTMSEVRLLSFVYAIWDAVAKDPQRKAALCLDWLLTEETFDSFFNNWCPMVRAYYQRLLCWRICRDDGSANEVDVNVMFAASTRLKTVWSHYLYLKRSAEEGGRAAPTTAPMCPALGKKFMIVRQESNSPQPGLLMGFDSFARTGCRDSLPMGGGIIPDAQLLAKGGDSKKRWSLLGRVLSMTSGNSAGPPHAAEGGLARSPFADGDAPFGARRGAMDAPLRPAPPLLLPNAAKANSARAAAAAASEADSLGSSPIYDEQRYTFKFILGWQQQSGPAAGRDLTRPKLPAPAQSQVAARCRGGSGSASPPLVAQATARHTFDARQSGPSPSPRERRSSVNASVEEWLRGTSMPTTGMGNEAWANGSAAAAGERRLGSVGEAQRASASTSPPPDRQAAAARETLVKAVKPEGIFARNAVYSGRALAEWAHVIAEFNSFVERRREEGVERLGEVEVPQLGVEGFRKMGG
ncbi:hypothetical protein CDD83_7297 [Cordyceps sp. RAO-2017]|nr:hypothetical protein CDD83_7297 [Cordyceps sp. RAO-2017]